MTTTTGPLKIVAAQDLGQLGPAEGQPVYFQWHWYYNLPGLPLWILLLLLAVVPKHNREVQAWLILLLPLALVVLWLLMVALLPDVSELEMVAQFLTAVAVAWASVWLMGPWLLRGTRLRVFFGSCAVAFAVGAVAYLSYFGFWFSADMTGPLLGFWTLCLLPLIGGTVLTGWCSRGHCRALQLIFWPMLWIPVVCALCTTLFLLAMAMLQGGDGLSILEFLIYMVLQGLVAATFISGLLYMLNLPVVLLCIFSPCYRQRYREGFCRPEDHDAMPHALGEPVGESVGGNPFRS